MRMKFSTLNVDFKSASFDPIGSMSPPYERIKFVYPLPNNDLLGVPLFDVLVRKDSPQPADPNLLVRN